MRFAFVDPGPLAYDLDSPGKIPLGGSESALCHLTAALSQAGHEVYFLKGQAAAHWSGRVRCLPLAPRLLGELRPLDAVVVLNAAGYGSLLRQPLGPQTPLVLWIHQAPDQPVLEPLLHAEVRSAYDGFACVSRWHADVCSRAFGLDRAKVGVMQNAVAPWFENLFRPGTSILEAKRCPPVLVYTSTPYRGLDRLLEVFPLIRAEVSDVTLRVFSSMTVYQMASPQESEHFGQLYERCRSMEGVEYHGSISQLALSQSLREATMLAYPNTYAETSCIAALEAMAAGCQVVTSHLAALPETTAGFAELISAATPQDWEAYNERFKRAVVSALQRLPDPAEASSLEEHLQRQVAHARERCTWSRRADEWCEWLIQLSHR